MPLDRELVVVSDPANQARSYSIQDNNAEGYSAETLRKIFDALGTLSSKVTLIDDVRAFADRLNSFSESVVIPCYFGPASRTSKALVPALCEAEGVPYIGADAYVQSLCNDKYFSRLYARSFGLPVSSAVLICSTEDIRMGSLARLKFPVVVKPNFGGGSNGIESENLCATPKAAAALCQRLFSYQQVPLTIESYVPGREVQVLLADSPDGGVITGQVGIKINGSVYFEKEIFDLSTKKRGEGDTALESVDCICREDLSTMRSIFKSLGKVGFMRIDCRVSKEGRATLLELSPDCSLGPHSGMAYFFRQKGMSYAEMFDFFIRGSL